jgi:2-methylcitrate dehydratase
MDRTTEILSAYACELTYADLPAEVIHQVKRTLVDTLGCAIGGFTAEPAQIARRLAVQSTSTTPARLLGTTDSSAPDLAGFANGVMVRYLDCNDSYFSPGGGHPSDMIAAVFALADARGCDGRTVITSIVLAYEIFCRLADQVNSGAFGWDQGIFSVIGAACAAGKILGLTRQQMAQAIALAVVPNLPLGVTRVGELSMWKGCAAASATRAGIFAAQLAEQGMTGPAEPFDGRRGLWEQALHTPIKLAAWQGDGTPHRILGTHFKRFPCQIHTQGPISLALDLRPRVAAAEIAALHLHTYAAAVHSAATEPEKWAPQTRETADHSIPYLVAVAFHDGMVTPSSFSDQRLHDPALRPLIEAMTVTEDADYTQRFPEAFPCRMEITTTSGQRLSAEAVYPQGHARNPLADAEVEGKFQRLSADLLTATQCQSVCELVWSLEQQPNLQALFDSLVVS